MSNVGPLIRSPHGLHSARTVRNPAADTEENRARLLELDTETGAVYVCPSRWQRVRLQWIFRHFHVLPLQLLRRYDQRLIEKLLRSAVVTPDLPVPKKSVVGVVEKVHSKPPASARQAARTEPAIMAKPVISILPRLDLANPEKRFVERLDFGYQPGAKSRRFPSGRKSIGVRTKPITDTALGRVAKSLRNSSLQLWALGVLTAVCLAVIVAQVCGISLVPGNRHTPSATAEQPAKSIQPRDLHTLAASPIRVSPTVPPVSSAGKPDHTATPRLPEPKLASIASQKSLQPDQLGQSQSPQSLTAWTDGTATTSEKATSSDAAAIIQPARIAAPAALAPAETSKPLFVSELPEDHFVHPVVSNPNLVGDLKLRALIGADGSVKEVTVLSGNPKLADAGIRAVRQWHFKPYQALGHPVEVETQIKMSFFGQDANSISSVATNSAAELK